MGKTDINCVPFQLRLCNCQRSDEKSSLRVVPIDAPGAMAQFFGAKKCAQTVAQVPFGPLAPQFGRNLEIKSN